MSTGTGHLFRIASSESRLPCSSLSRAQLASHQNNIFQTTRNPADTCAHHIHILDTWPTGSVIHFKSPHLFVPASWIRCGVPAVLIMPRDLEAEKPSPPPVTLTESPNSVGTERSDSPHDAEESPTSNRGRFVITPEDQKNPAPTTLHPYTRPLTISDLDSVVALENASFPNPEERASKEKVSHFSSRTA